MKDTKYTAIPVEEGDAFLLETPYGDFLVDGGIEENGCLPNKLKGLGIHGLTAAACTHTDKDHINGIHDLMRHRFPVIEYWLPSSWLDLSYASTLFEGSWEDWFKEVKEQVEKSSHCVIDTEGEDSEDYIHDIPIDDIEYSPEGEDLREPPEDFNDETMRAYMGTASVSTGLLAAITLSTLSENTEEREFHEPPGRGIFALIRASGEIFDDFQKDKQKYIERFTVGYPHDRHYPYHEHLLNDFIFRFLRDHEISQSDLIRDIRDYFREYPDWLFPFFSYYPYPYSLALTDILCMACSAFSDKFSIQVPEIRKTIDIATMLSLSSKMFSAITIAPSLIRFFDYQKRIVNHPITPHPFCCINGAEVTKPIRMPRVLTAKLMYQYSSLTTVNRKSRTFHFEDDECEAVFCADSNFSFVGNMPGAIGQYRLGKPAIVTAPHHGSKDKGNVNVYQIVTSTGSQGLTWVRSDKKTIRRPCPEYKNLPVKYCTTCKKQNQQKIEVVFDKVTRTWKTGCSPCSC